MNDGVIMNGLAERGDAVIEMRITGSSQRVIFARTRSFQVKFMNCQLNHLPIISFDFPDANQLVVVAFRVVRT